MSWNEIKPMVKYTAGAAAADVSMSCTVDGGRFARRIYITARIDRLTHMTFWREDARVKVLLGQGDHAGHIRIVPGEAFKLRSGGPRALTPGQAPILVIPALPGMLAGKWKKTAVEFDYEAAWLEITLPEWCRPPAVGAMPPDAAVPPPPSGSSAPFRGMLATQKHDTSRGS